MAEHLWLFRKIWNFMPNMKNELFSRDWTIVQLVAAQ